MRSPQRVQDFIDMISNVMEAYTTSLFVVDEEKNNYLKLYSYLSFSKKLVKNCTLSPGEGIVGWVFREQKPVLAAHFDRSTKTLKFYSEDEEIKSLMAVPLPEKMGVLCVDSKKSYRFTEEREKIFRQMAVTAVSLIKGERERKEKEFLHNLVKFLVEMEDVIESSSKNISFVDMILSRIVNKLQLSHAFFVVPGNDVHICEKDTIKNETKCNKEEKDYYSPDGLLGWTVKNNKKLVIEKRNEKREKSFILNKKEEIKQFSNIICIPLSNPSFAQVGAFGCIKEKKDKWEKLEIEILERVLDKFFRKWILN